MARKVSRYRTYEVRFMDGNGKQSSFFTTTTNPSQAKRKLKTKGCQILWIKKAA